MNHKDESNRRPLATRNLSIMKRIAKWLSNRNVTPNQISLASIAFASVGFVSGVGYSYYPSWLWLLLFLLAIQMRLLCNLFDGMVAIEGSKKTPAGELFNDVPDRIADPLLILGAGFIGASPYAMDLAWAAAILAVLTAYVRVLGVSMGCDADFQGPMAKQHRMALLTVTGIALLVCQYFSIWPQYSLYVMDASLSIMVLGILLTTWKRLRAIYLAKQSSPTQTAE